MRGAKGREKYVWTLWPTFCVTKKCNNCIQQLQVKCMICNLKHLASDTVLCSLCPHWQTVMTENAFRMIPLGTHWKQSSRECTQSVISTTGKVATAVVSSQWLEYSTASCLSAFALMRSLPAEHKAQSRINIVECHHKREVHDVMCLILNKPIRFEPRTSVWMFLENSRHIFSPSHSSHSKWRKIQLAHETKLVRL